MYIRVDVSPKAKKENIKVISDDTLEISVREPALQNLANARVAILVARHYGVSRSSVRLISGHRSTRKVFAVDV